MVAPALLSISSDLHITNQVESQIVLSIFVLAYAIGPLFLGPLSEIYGRVPVLQLANLFYLVFNLACGFAQNKAEMIVFRFLSGLGGSAPLAVWDFFGNPMKLFSSHHLGWWGRLGRLLARRSAWSCNCSL